MEVSKRIEACLGATLSGQGDRRERGSLYCSVRASLLAVIIGRCFECALWDVKDALASRGHTGPLSLLHSVGRAVASFASGKVLDSGLLILSTTAHPFGISRVSKRTGGSHFQTRWISVRRIEARF